MSNQPWTLSVDADGYHWRYEHTDGHAEGTEPTETAALRAIARASDWFTQSNSQQLPRAVESKPKKVTPAPRQRPGV